MSSTHTTAVAAATTTHVTVTCESVVVACDYFSIVPYALAVLKIDPSESNSDESSTSVIFHSPSFMEMME